MRLFLVHNSLTATVREDTFDGRPFLVAPVVCVKAGVLNGELLQADAISIKGWNNRPVVLTHPINDQGAPISANSKQVLETMVFGTLLNCALVDNGLSGELWVDLGKAEQLGGDAQLCVDRLKAGEPIEVSTGYWCDVEAKAGKFNGQSYSGVQHNLVPDHLALLPHDIGACSWETGCGAPRVNVACNCEGQEEEKPVKENWLLSKLSHLLRTFAPQQLAANIKQSAGEVEDALWDAIAEVEKPGYNSYIYIEAVYPTTKMVVYRVDSYDSMARGPLYQRSYTIDVNGAATLGDPTEVVAETTYKTVKPTANSKEDSTAQPEPTPESEPTVIQQQQGDEMDKKAMVAAIMKANSMDAAAEAGLLLLNEDQLKKLMADEPKKEEPKAQPTTQAAQPTLSADALEITARQNASAATERADHTKILVDNEVATAETCAKMTLGELSNMAAKFSGPVDYAGRGFGARTVVANDKKKLAPDIEPVFPIGAGFTKNGQTYLKGIQADVQE